MSEYIKDKNNLWHIIKNIKEPFKLIMCYCGFKRAFFNTKKELQTNDTLCSKCSEKLNA